MYPYHNRIKQRIANGELVGFQFVDDYPRIGECLVLQFNTYPPIRPIRPHRFPEYTGLLIKWARQFTESQRRQEHDPSAERQGSCGVP